MAWYDTGTVAVTNGSTTVTGTGTNFVSGAQVGEGFQGPDGKLYEIASITSATVLVLADAYLGSTQSGQAYKIVPTQSLVADLASQVSTLITDYQNTSDGLITILKAGDGAVGTPSITFNSDQDTGFYHDTANEIAVSIGGVKKAEFNSTGLDVTGTATMDGLTVDGNANISSVSPYLDLSETDTVDLDTRLSNLSGLFRIATIPDAKSSSKFRLGIDHATGDISFYEDTGTTAKFYWDASAESLGIGTTTPESILDVRGEPYFGQHTTNPTVRVVSSNTATPASGTRVGTLAFSANQNNIADITAERNAGITTVTGSDERYTNLAFYTSTVGGGAERMRLTSSGDLLVGTTDNNVGNNSGGTDVGISLREYGEIQGSASSACLVLNRQVSDGDVAVFKKDGAPVGSIGSISGAVSYFVLDPRTNGAGIKGSSAKIVPTNQTGGDTDATIDLGGTAVRWKDLYLSGGVYLGGTGAANKLDSYEEGTFSPVVADASTGGNTATASGSSGSYVKIGSQVTVQIILSNIDTTGLTGTSNIFIRGLPFNPDTTGRGCCLAENITFAGNYLVPVAFGSASYLAIYQVTSGNVDTPLPISAITSTTGDIGITLTYTTAS